MSWSRLLHTDGRYLALGALLLAQFGLGKALRPEPYPLIMLPGGSSTKKHDQELTAKQYLLVLRTKEGSERRVEPHTLLAELPPQYRFRVLRHMLEVGLGRTEWERQETRAWLQKRFDQLSVGDPVSVKVQELLLRPATTDPAKGREIVSERDLDGWKGS